MRKLKYGLFVNKPFVAYGDDWDMLPIGAHSVAIRLDEQNMRTAHYEYYYKEKNGQIHIVRDLTKKEILFARFTSLFSNKVKGNIQESIIDSSKSTYYEVRAKEIKEEENSKENTL